MEGLIGILILGWCLYMVIRHPLKTLSFLFKIGFILGIGGFLILFYFMMGEDLNY